MNETAQAHPRRQPPQDAAAEQMISSFHVLGSRQLGGADQFFVRLVAALTQAGHPTTAIARPRSPIIDVLAARQLNQHPLPLASQWDLVSLWRLRRLVRRERPMVVQTYMGRATRLTRIPKHWPTVHIARLGGYYKLRGYYGHAHAWVGNTRGICDYLVRSGLPADRVFHIGNFAPEPEPVSEPEQARIRERLALPDDALVVFALARLVAKKGMADLLAAFAQLPAAIQGRPLHLVVAGDGPLRDELAASAQDLGVDPRVHWTGWVEPGAYFQLADLAVCPSRHEPLGNVILEAWSYGLPVVSTRTAGGEELIEHEQNGLLAPVEDPNALATAIRHVLEQPASARQSLAEAGRATLQRQHSRESVMAQYLDLYRQLARERGIL